MLDPSSPWRLFRAGSEIGDEERQQLYKDHEELLGVLQRNVARNIARLRKGKGISAAKSAFKDDAMAELPDFKPSAITRILDFGDAAGVSTSPPPKKRPKKAAKENVIYFDSSGRTASSPPSAPRSPLKALSEHSGSGTSQSSPVVLSP